MKKYLWMLGPIATVLCIGFGIMLPHIVFSFKDRKISEKEEIYTIPENRINYASSVVDTLEYFNYGMRTIECSQDIARLSSDEAIKIGVNFINGFNWNQYGAYLDKISSNCVSDCACAVAVSDSYESDIEADWQKQNVVYEKESSDSFASIIWEVNYELSDMQRIHLVIDDNNKKVIGFGIWDDNIIDSMLENEEFIYLFARYLGQYYDVNFEIIHQNMQEDGMLCEYTCELTTNEGKCIQKKIVIKEDTFGFM